MFGVALSVMFHIGTDRGGDERLDCHLQRLLVEGGEDEGREKTRASPVGRRFGFLRWAARWGWSATIRVRTYKNNKE